MDELELFEGPLDFEEMFRQNPGEIDDAFCQDPECGHPRCNDPEQLTPVNLEVIRAALTVQAEEFLKVAHLDVLVDMSSLSDLDDE